MNFIVTALLMTAAFYASTEGIVCPSGFTPSTNNKKCFSIFPTLTSWDAHRLNCAGLVANAQMAIPDDSSEYKDLLTLKAQFPNPERCVEIRDNQLFFYISGRTVSGNQCGQLVWKDFSGEFRNITYDMWDRTNGFIQPDCYQGIEYCMQVNHRNLWNDVDCSRKMCAFCEYNPSLITSPATTTDIPSGFWRR